jgi:formyltetrahydrofolate deformylase
MGLHLKKSGIFAARDTTKKIIMDNQGNAILLIHCQDTPGIIAEITNFITVNKGNIVNLDQHVDHRANAFFMRIEWQLEHFLIPKDRIGEYFQTLYANKYGMEFWLYFTDQKPRMAIFVSKMSHCLYDMLARYSAGEWNVDIPLIVSNHEDLRPIAEQFGIPFHVFPITPENKAAQEAEELKLLKANGVTFIVLARYMQVISDDMIASYPNKIINIHHSFLPAFVGAKPYHQAYERGVKIIGATSHYVNAELDAGPIIEQDVARITHKDSVETLVSKGRDLEKIVLSRAVVKHIDRKILVFRNKTVIFD